MARAQLILGLSYADGKAVPEDRVEAVGWFRQAAEQWVTAELAALDAFDFEWELFNDPMFDFEAVMRRCNWPVEAALI